MDSEHVGFLRIGELSRRTGVSPELLRAWERRYGVLRPSRSEGGFRLYSTEDEQRIRRMQALLGNGISASEAARIAGEHREAETSNQGQPVPLPDALGASLRDALDSFDGEGADAALDRLLVAFPVDVVIQDVILPYIRDLGTRWEEGTASIEQEHFASNILRSRLFALGRGWGSGAGRLALLACLPGELHELGLISFGVALRDRGWRISYLGADTPLASLEGAANALTPDVTVVTGTQRSAFLSASPELRAIGKHTALAIAGSGADADLATSVGARLLEGDPVTASAII